MAKFTVLSNLKHDGEDYAAGSVLELDPRVARPLVKGGTLEPYKEPDPPKKEEPKKEEPKPPAT